MEANRGRMIGMTVVWLFFIVVAAMSYRWIFKPKADQAEAESKDKAKKEVVVATGSEARHKHAVNLALDSFSGYALLRSEAFASELSSRGIKIDLVDDGAAYKKRLQSMQAGEVQMAVFPLDALIKASAELGDMPATIIALIDESLGADAMVANSKTIPNIDALNDPSTKFVGTADSPSETLGRVVVAHFNLQRMAPDPWEKLGGAKEVFDAYRNSKPTDRKVFILWEPYVSKILENPDYRVVMDTSKVRGYVVDSVVVSRDFLLKNEGVVRNVLEAYAKVHFASRKSMPEIVLHDAQSLGEPLKPKMSATLCQKIRWTNTLENYGHFGFSTGHGLQHVGDMIANITRVMLKTKAISSDPTGGKPNVLYYDKILRQMFDAGFYPGQEEVNQDKRLTALSEDDWKTLLPVGTLEVPRLVFARGTANLTQQSEETLNNLAKELKSWPQFYLTVVGNSSKDGDPQANKKLANDRAQTAVDWLVKAGVDKRRVRSTSSDPNGSTTVMFLLGQLPY
jgi:flagellar motor protein MotB